MEGQCWRLLEGGQSPKNSKVLLELEGAQSPKNSEGAGGWNWKSSETPLERKGGCPLTTS